MSFEQKSLRIKSDYFKDYSFKAPNKPAEVNFILGYHGNAEDFPLSLRTDHEDADLVVHELMGWNPDYRETLNQIARGEYVSSGPELPLNQRKIELIENTTARQEVWDIPGAFAQIQAHMQYHVMGGMRNDLLSLQASSDNAAPVLERYLTMIAARDKYGTRAITRHINNVETKSDAPVKVSVIAGLAHVGMANAYADLAEQHEDLDVKISATHESLCISALCSYIMARYEKGSLSASEITQLGARVLDEDRLAIGNQSLNDVLLKHYGLIDEVIKKA